MPQTLAPVTAHTKQYIGGTWIDAESSETLPVVNSATEEIFATVPQGTVEEARAAVAAARAALPEWSRSTPAERAAILRAIREGLEARQDELGEVIARELGMPLKLSKAVQVGGPMRTLDGFAELVESFEFEEMIGAAKVVKEPMGVVACITPWNFPLNQIISKIAPALSAGCTLIVKPSEITPVSALILAEIIDATDLPKGVFNLVNGLGPIVGEALATDPDVDMVSFTGSTRAGCRVSELASATIKRVTLELGGKSPNIILEDADLEKAVTSGVGHAYFNSGQVCVAKTRMLVPRERHDEAVEIAKKAAETYTLGDPFDEDTRMGPLSSFAQQERVRGYIEKGKEEGATLVMGGSEQPEDHPEGYYVQPTIFANVSNDMTIAREEIFGPVLSILPYDDEEDAIRIANDTIYGLSSAIWTGDVEHGKEIARRIDAGQVIINDARGDIGAPFGGFKQSGNGREGGKYGLEEFLQPKTIQA